MSGVASGRRAAIASPISRALGQRSSGFICKARSITAATGSLTQGARLRTGGGGTVQRVTSSAPIVSVGASGVSPVIA